MDSSQTKNPPTELVQAAGKRVLDDLNGDGNSWKADQELEAGALSNIGTIEKQAHNH